MRKEAERKRKTTRSTLLLKVAVAEVRMEVAAHTVSARIPLWLVHVVIFQVDQVEEVTAAAVVVVVVTVAVVRPTIDRTFVGQLDLSLLLPRMNDGAFF